MIPGWSRVQMDDASGGTEVKISADISEILTNFKVKFKLPYLPNFLVFAHDLIECDKLIYI